MNRWMNILLVAVGMLVATAAKADITISAAVSLKAALEKAQPVLETAAGEPVRFTFGASGTLAAQIQQGAPVDLFISADRANVTRLVEVKAAEKGTEVVIAGNELVLVTPRNTAGGPAPAIKGFADLAAVKRMAMGEPKVVPAGTYAREVLTHLQLWDALDKGGRIITGENVAAVLTYVERGEVDAGLVYATDAKTSKGVVVAATADAAWHGPIEYVSAVVSGTRHRPAAIRVQAALAGDAVQGVLKGFGFTPPPRAAPTSRQ